MTVEETSLISGVLLYNCHGVGVAINGDVDSGGLGLPGLQLDKDAGTLPRGVRRANDVHRPLLRRSFPAANQRSWKTNQSSSFDCVDHRYCFQHSSGNQLPYLLN